MKKIFLIISLISPFFITANAEQWDKNITTKVDVESFWKQVKETREIKYGVDKDWDKNMDYCSHFAEKIALSTTGEFDGEEQVVYNIGAEYGPPESKDGNRIIFASGKLTIEIATKYNKVVKSKSKKEGMAAKLMFEALTASLP